MVTRYDIGKMTAEFGFSDAPLPPNLAVYPYSLIERMAAELKYLQSIAGSIAKPGDQARLNGIVSEWEAFNQ